ncbi:hypothetical protein ABZY57_05000 [Streptomyces sp. NPDC006450]|uniref:hypothetical protein n=1 Tax=Streptomyces sp. NPDC006450 TaxID=3155458 RepID=UPI0033A4A51E
MKLLSHRGRIRVGMLVAATAGTLVMGLASPASAAIGVPGDRYGVYFEANGDKLQACDNNPDGWGVYGELWVNGVYNRSVTTQGHASPYCTPWKTGDIQEPANVEVKAWLRRGSDWKWVGSAYGQA